MWGEEERRDEPFPFAKFPFAKGSVAREEDFESAPAASEDFESAPTAAAEDFAPAAAAEDFESPFDNVSLLPLVAPSVMIFSIQASEDASMGSNDPIAREEKWMKDCRESFRKRCAKDSTHAVGVQIRDRQSSKARVIPRWYPLEEG